MLSEAGNPYHTTASAINLHFKDRILHAEIRILNFIQINAISKQNFKRL